MVPVCSGGYNSRLMAVFVWKLFHVGECRCLALGVSPTNAEIKVTFKRNPELPKTIS